MKFDISAIPDDKLNEVSSVIIESMVEFFNDPKNREEFEKWKMQKKGRFNDSQQTDVYIRTTERDRDAVRYLVRCAEGNS